VLKKGWRLKEDANLVLDCLAFDIILCLHCLSLLSSYHELSNNGLLTHVFTPSLFQKNKNARRRQKKLKAYDLSTLTDFLPDLTEEQNPAPPANSEVNCKSRQELV